MPRGRTNGVNRLPRRWLFAGCVFDEANWTLVVDGRRVPIETKPLEILRELLLSAGNIVSKEELLDTIWPEVTVVEASLPTAIHKLRAALGDDRRERKIIETASGIGYRVSVPVEMDDRSADASEAAAAAHYAAVEAHALAAAKPSAAVPRLMIAAAALAIGLAAIVVAFAPSPHVAEARTKIVYGQSDAEKAIRHLDIPAIEKMLAAGWDPNTPWDKEGNDALGALLGRCEWDRGHDERKMLLMARTLVEGGAAIDRRNIWGDTAYSIAKAPRYCGPDHPVTQMLEAICYGGDMGPRDLCLATYELTPAQRRAQGLPPKG